MDKKGTVDEEGNCYEIVGELVSTVTPRSVDGSYAATYAYDVSKVTNADGYDGAYASHVYLTVYYKLRDGQHYLLTAVSGYWVMEDYNVTVTSAKLSYGCHPYETVSKMTVSNNFHIYTGFTMFTPDNGTYSTVGANLELKYLMGNSRTWTFMLQNNVLG